MENQYKNISSSFKDARQSPATIFFEAPSVAHALGNVVNLDVIDFACGEGYYTRLMKKMGAKTVLGIDLSPEMVELARLQETESPLGISYGIADAASGQEFGQFDIVTAMFLFNYADDIATLQRMFDTVARNLRQDGRLIAVVPNPNFVNGRKDTLQYGYFLDEVEWFPEKIKTKMTFVGDKQFSIEFTQWSKESYESVLNRSGFEDVDWIPFRVTDEGIANFGSDFWASALENPKSLILSAKKKPSVG